MVSALLLSSHPAQDSDLVSANKGLQYCNIRTRVAPLDIYALPHLSQVCPLAIVQIEQLC
jgi:hypothetical protein